MPKFGPWSKTAKIPVPTDISCNQFESSFQGGGRAGQGRAGQGRAGQGRAGPYAHPWSPLFGGLVRVDSEGA
jgi:hypothetical protein